MRAMRAPRACALHRDSKYSTWNPTGHQQLSLGGDCDVMIGAFLELKHDAEGQVAESRYRSRISFRQGRPRQGFAPPITSCLKGCEGSPKLLRGGAARVSSSPSADNL